MRQRAKDTQQDRMSHLFNEEELDGAEQWEIVTALERTHAAQSRSWRLIFGVLGAALGGLLLYFAVHQALNPWRSHRHHSAFHRTMPSLGVCAAEAISGLTCIASAAALLVRSIARPGGKLPEVAIEGVERLRRRTGVHGWSVSKMEQSFAGLSVTGAAVMAVLWGSALSISFANKRVVSGQVVRLLWLPIAPLGYTLLVWYILRSMQRTEAELKALRTQMYTFHKA